MRYFKALTVRTKRIKVSESDEKYCISVQTPKNIADLARRILDGEDRESVLAFPLDVKNKPLGFYVVGREAIDACPVDPREVFRAAVMLSASAIIVVHNHPSGDPIPSKEDKQQTERLSSAGKLLGIPLMDHVIVTETRHTSLREFNPELF